MLCCDSRMTDSWYEDAAWDDPVKFSRNSRCDLKHFSTATRNFRDELNNEEIRVSSNQDLMEIVKSPRYKHRDWWQYVDPAASRSMGREDSTAIVLWECANHVLTCRKIRGKWSLLAGYSLGDLLDIVDFRNQRSPGRHDPGYPQDQLSLDDELDDIISFLSDEDENELPIETTVTNSTSIHDDLEDEDTEHSLLKLDRDLEESLEIVQSSDENDGHIHSLGNMPSIARLMNQKNTSDQIQNFEKQVETLTNKLHESLDEIALLKHQVRIEKEHNLALQQGKDLWEKRYRDLNSDFDTAVNEKNEAERRALRHQVGQLESRVEELKNLEKSRNIRIKQLSDEVLKLKRDCANHETEKSRLIYTIDQQKNEITRLDLTIDSPTSKSEIPNNQPSADSNSSINAEMESLELSFQQALNRERILLEQLAVNAENTSQLENQVRELSQEILHVQENNSKIVKENEELKDVLTQTKEEFELVKAAEQVHKTIEIQELNSAHEQELSYVNSRFSQAVEKNFQLNNQIAELDRSIISLKNEKKLNDMALAKLEEVISLLDERLPEIEHISDDNQTVNSNPEIKKRRRFLRGNN